MLLGEALYKQLTTATLTTHLGSTAIYPIVIEEKKGLPAVTYQEISETRVHAMGADPGLAYPRYQISCWSTAYPQVKAMADAVRSILQDFSTKLGGAAGMDIQRIFFENEVDLWDVNPMTNKIIYHVAQDYIIWHS